MDITEIFCDHTDCKYNSACCCHPCDPNNKRCTCKRIDITVDDDCGMIDCKQYEYDYTKPYQCMDCQLEVNGEIEVEFEVNFEEVDNFNDLF